MFPEPPQDPELDKPIAPPEPPARKLTGAEQRELMKQEYKKELMLRKQMHTEMKEADTNAKLAKNLAQVEKLSGPNDDTDEWIRKLNETSAIGEAKLEMALGIDTPFIKTPETHSLPSDIAVDPNTLAPSTKSLGDEERKTETPTADTSTPETPIDPNAEPPLKKSLGDLEI